MGECPGDLISDGPSGVRTQSPALPPFAPGTGTWKVTLRKQLGCLGRKTPLELLLVALCQPRAGGANRGCRMRGPGCPRVAASGDSSSSELVVRWRRRAPCSQVPQPDSKRSPRRRGPQDGGGRRPKSPGVAGLTGQIPSKMLPFPGSLGLEVTGGGPCAGASPGVSHVSPGCKARGRF